MGGPAVSLPQSPPSGGDPTSHLGKPGDLLTIMSYACVEEGLAKKWQPRVIVLGPDNQIINERGV
jgi:aspartate 1-decarboxylase